VPVGASRRGILLRAAAGAAGVWLGACRPGERGPLLSFGPRVVRVAAFLPQESQFGTDRAVVELQLAANAINRRQPGFEIAVDYMLLPPRPTPVPGGPTIPTEGATPVPTPTPFVASAITLEHALGGGELAAGAPPPDLVLISQSQAFEMPALLERRLIEPLEEVLKAERSIKLDEFVPGALDAVRYRGRVAALPLAGWVNVLLYDAALFDAAGVPRPAKDWTWTGFLEAARRLTRAGPEREQWGTLAHQHQQLLLALIWSHGGDLLARDGRRSALAEPGAREGIQFWADLLVRHRVAPVPAPGQNLSYNWNQSEMWVVSPQPNQPMVFGGAATAGSNPRVAMMVASSLPSVFGGPPSGPRTILAADLPKGRQRATQLGLSAALALGTKAQDQRLALRAAAALVDHLAQAPVGGSGYPVRKPDPDLLRRLQPRLTDEDAEAVSGALGYSRAVPPELTRSLFAVLNGKLMAPLLRGQATADEAARDAAAALEEALRA
jgi:ABC-type glycerol-3-phosphate transport system substrate-binding protein